MTRYRTAFFGTPPFSVPALQALSELSDVVGVVCQPDRRAGRGMKLQAPAVKQRALSLSLPVYQPSRVRDGALQTWLERLRVDVAVVAAYGRILPTGVLTAPRVGCVNLHASVLPEYRGAAPIQWALMDGRTETGISLMHMDEGMDTGPVYSVHRLAIPPRADAAELTRALSELAARVLVEDLPGVLQGSLTPTPQDETRASHAPPIERRHQIVDFERPPEQVANQIRALAPRPGAACLLRGRRLKILRAHAQPEPLDGPPGTVARSDESGIAVACGGGSLVIESAQLEGRRAQDAGDLVRGRVVGVGDRLEALVSSGAS